MFKKTTTNPTNPRYVTERQARELADELVRTALREQARDLEKHLMDIDKRLRELEKRS